MHCRGEGKLLEAQRVLARTRYGLEMMEEIGYCAGVENYSRHLDGRAPGVKPYTLLDYFRHTPGRAPDDWLVFIDESHATIPQFRGMHHGDRSRTRERQQGVAATQQKRTRDDRIVCVVSGKGRKQTKAQKENAISDANNAKLKTADIHRHLRIGAVQQAPQHLAHQDH